MEAFTNLSLIKPTSQMSSHKIPALSGSVQALAAAGVCCSLLLRAGGEHFFHEPPIFDRNPANPFARIMLWIAFQSWGRECLAAKVHLITLH